MQSGQARVVAAVARRGTSGVNRNCHWYVKAAASGATLFGFHLWSDLNICRKIPDIESDEDMHNRLHKYTYENTVMQWSVHLFHIVTVQSGNDVFKSVLVCNIAYTYPTVISLNFKKAVKKSPVPLQSVAVSVATGSAAAATMWAWRLAGLTFCLCWEPWQRSPSSHCATAAPCVNKDRLCYNKYKNNSTSW